jgi:CheY-like chemotaxis protein
MSLNVMFVDDEEALCECFKDLFENNEIKITTFSDPKIALENVTALKPDLIFVDYRIPSMNGDELASKLPPSIPKYLITGELEPKPNYNFNGILPKPFDYKKLEQVLAEHLKSKK